MEGDNNLLHSAPKVDIDNSMWVLVDTGTKQRRCVVRRTDVQEEVKVGRKEKNEKLERNDSEIELMKIMNERQNVSIYEL